MTNLLMLIQQDAKDEADKSGKTALDDWLNQPSLIPPDSSTLVGLVKALSSGSWKEWRALRHIVRRLKIRDKTVGDAVANLTEAARPSDARARYYAYLARAELGNRPEMGELLEDKQLLDERPMDWLELAYSETTASTLHHYYLASADKLRADDFNFSLAALREKYSSKFPDYLEQLCLAMPLVEALSLADTVDKEFQCGIRPQVESSHSALRNSSPDQPDGSNVIVASFDDKFKRRLAR